jgi:choline/glycine/proline betaine transport protein
MLALAAVSIETANSLLIATKDDVVRSFDWLFVGVASGALGVVVLAGISPRANVTLGPDGDEPEFGRFAWFSMLFSAGLASGLLYWAAAEPLLHFQASPLLAQGGIAANSEAAVQSALRITIFHWGLHGWGMYVVGALAISIFAYRYNQPLRFRSALYPVLGPKWIKRWPGDLVDLLALLGTVFGVATSIGLSASSLNATLAPLLGITVDVQNQIAIVAAVCALGVISAMTGVGRGIRRLSELNVWISLGFLLAILLLGPTARLLSLTFTSMLDYLITFLPLGLWVGASAEERAWQSDWTVFYWGWWLAWMPFVSLFIARISKGRTVREFVVGVMCAPTLIIIIWMSILGGSALHQELAEPGSLTNLVNQDYSLGLAAMLGQLTAPALALFLTGVAAFLLFTWLITSLDSATLVICHLIDRADNTAHQILWGTVLGVVTAALIWMGGINALQAASIIMGLPLAVVTMLIAGGLVKSLWSKSL